MSNKVAVILWLYHNDLTDEFYNLLYPIQDLIDLYLCLCDKNNNIKTIDSFGSMSCTKYIGFYPNIGVDIYSFLKILPTINNKYFIKLHSKKSFWGTKRHCNWRSMLIDSFIGNRDALLKNTGLMDKKRVNYLSSYALTYKNHDYYHGSKIREILNILNLNIDTSESRFCGGNMFMGRTKFYQDVFNKHTDHICDLLSAECGKINETVDGTYCHGMERVFGYIVNSANFTKTILDTIKLRIFDKNLASKKINFLHLRKMYNNDIYCIEQPNIYGSVETINEDNFQVLWKHMDNHYLAKYHKIYNKVYLNDMYAI